MAVNRKCLLSALESLRSNIITAAELKRLTKECANPQRPPREFWDEVFPQVREYYGERYPHDPERAERLARETTGSIWFHKISPRRKEKFERVRRSREQ